MLQNSIHKRLKYQTTFDPFSEKNLNIKNILTEYFTIDSLYFWGYLALIRTKGYMTWTSFQLNINCFVLFVDVWNPSKLWKRFTKILLNITATSYVHIWDYSTAFKVELSIIIIYVFTLYNKTQTMITLNLLMYLYVLIKNNFVK